MATRYARSNVVGVWALAANWSDVSSSDPGPSSDYPKAGDTVIFDSGFTGTITMGQANSCTVLNMSGNGGTLALATYTLTVAGNVTLGGTITMSGAGGITVSAAATIAGNGVAFSGLLTFLTTGNKTINSSGTSWGNITVGSGITITLGDTLAITGTLSMATTGVTFAGAFNISCATLIIGYISAMNYTFVTGTTVTVSTNLYAASANSSAQITIKSSTTTPFNLTYNGTAANCKVAGVIFQYVTYSGGTVTNLDNWYGGTITGGSGITNVTSANLARASDASKILTGQTVGGVSGSASAGSGGGPIFGGMVVR